MDIDHLGRYDGTGADITVIDARRVRLARRVLVDLGGIAKGHAVDRAVAAMIAAGAPCGLVNAGGDLRGFGAMDWAIGLRDADGAVR
ncbi:FAD:protein FMN transferase, partial [Vibrio parahaemolyticus]